jgi:nucleotide-binding universal stress UspA family protein
LSGTAKRQVLVLTDGSPAARAAVTIAISCAKALDRPLAVLGAAEGAENDEAVGAAVQEAQTLGKKELRTVIAVQSSGDLLELASQRVADVPTCLVVAGSRREPVGARIQITPRVWTLIKSLQPPVLVASEEHPSPLRWLFCTGGAAHIEDGAQFAAGLAKGLGATVTVFHVSPMVPGIFGDRLEEEEENAEQFLRSNSRIAKGVQRHVDVFRKAGVPTKVRVRTGEVVDGVLEEMRSGGHDLVVVGSSPQHGPIRTYLMGDVTRDIVTLSSRPFLVLRSRQPAFWESLWRS